MISPLLRLTQLSAIVLQSIFFACSRTSGKIDRWPERYQYRVRHEQTIDARTIITGLLKSAGSMLGALKFGPIGLLTSSIGLDAFSLLGSLAMLGFSTISAFRLPRLEFELE